MATTKKKSTTKKKNTKSKKASTARATSKKSLVNKKVVSKKVSKKNVSTKSVISKKSKTKKPLSKLQILNNWNWIAALLHAGSGAAILILSNTVNRAVTLNYLTKDPIASTQANPVLVQATRNMFDINIAYLLAATFFIAALVHLLMATVHRKKYETDMASGVNKLRWIEYGVSGGLMLAIVGMLSGITDFSILGAIIDVMIVGGLLGLAMEFYKKATKKTSWFVYIVSGISVITALSLLKINFLGTYQYGEGSLPTYTYWISGTVVAYLILMGLVVGLHHSTKDIFKQYIDTEKAYMLLSFVAKSALAWQVYFAILN